MIEIRGGLSPPRIWLMSLSVYLAGWVKNLDGEDTHGTGGCPNFELRSKFTRSAASADRAPLKTRHRRVFFTLRALSGSNPPPSASAW